MEPSPEFRKENSKEEEIRGTEMPPASEGDWDLTNAAFPPLGREEENSPATETSERQQLVIPETPELQLQTDAAQINDTIQAPNIRSENLILEINCLYENWDELDKDIRALHLQRVTSLITEYVEAAVQETRTQLEQLPPISAAELIQLSPSEFSSFIDREQQIENTVRELIKELNLATVLLTSGPIVRGRKEFGTSTGFLDNNPKIAGALAVTSSLLAMGGMVYGLVLGHHHVAEATAAVLGQVATPGTWLYSSLDFTAHATILLVDSLIAFSASAAGALGFGFLKTALGRLWRRTESGNTAFEVECEAAEGLQTNLMQSIERTGNAIQDIGTVLPAFYSRNEHIRAAASHFILELEGRAETPGREPGVAEDSPLEEIEDKAWQIGRHEFQDTLQMLRLERTFAKLGDVDVRSAEMKGLEEISGGEPLEEHRGGILGWCGKQLALTTKTVLKTFGASDQAGTRAALEMANQISHDLNDLPASAFDTFAGLGSGLSHFLGVMIEGGQRPEQSLLETFKGFIHLLNFGADRKHGPGFKELVRLILEVPDMKDPGRRARWFGKFIPNIALLVFKKPALFVRLAREQEQRGVIDPESLKNEVYTGRGRVANAWYMTKEICKALGQATIGGLAKLCIEKPLSAAAALQRRSSILRLLPSAVSALKGWYGIKKGRLQNDLNNLQKNIPDGADLQSRSEEYIQQRVLKALVEYQYGSQDAASFKEVKALLQFWDKWDNLRYLDGLESELVHKDELRAIDGRLQNLPALARGNSKTFIESLKSFGSFIMADPDEKKPEPEAGFVPEKLIKFAEQYNANNQSRYDRPLILDAIPGGTIVVKDPDGSLQFMHGAEARNYLLDWHHSVGSKHQRQRNLCVGVLPHGDDARIATAQVVLGMPLEFDQAEALINVHHRALNKQAGLISYTKELLKHHFTIEQLFGAEGADLQGRAFPGIFKLGLIGNDIPGDKELDRARRAAVEYLEKQDEQRRQAVKERLEAAMETERRTGSEI